MLSAAETNVKPAKDHQQALFDIQQKSVSLQKSIDEIVGALADPLIVPKSAWAATIPAWLRQHITFARLIDLMKTKGDISMATDAEACAYLMPLTLDAPFDREWAEIYLYVSTKTCRAVGKEVPADVAVENLDKYSMDELTRLKCWIYQKRLQHRKARQRAERTERKENNEHTQICMGRQQDFGRGHGKTLCTQESAEETDHGIGFRGNQDLFGKGE
jgi:hypothetical protein